jgi:hypothetical protein
MERTRVGRCPLYVRNHCYASTHGDHGWSLSTLRCVPDGLTILLGGLPAGERVTLTRSIPLSWLVQAATVLALRGACLLSASQGGAGQEEVIAAPELGRAS